MLIINFFFLNSFSSQFSNLLVFLGSLSSHSRNNVENESEAEHLHQNEVCEYLINLFFFKYSHLLV